MISKQLAALVAVVALAGCASHRGADNASAPATPAASADPDLRIVKSKDGRFDGEMVGTPAPGSRFAKLSIGMTYEEVTAAIGAPANMAMHETGKRWIPFYFGNDVVRMETIYPGEGCLSFTGGNQFGGGGHELIRITADPSGKKCAL